MASLSLRFSPSLRRAATLAGDESGATTLEWALLLAAIAIPSYYIMMIAFNTLVEHYRMITLINSLPFP